MAFDRYSTSSNTDSASGGEPVPDRAAAIAVAAGFGAAIAKPIEVYGDDETPAALTFMVPAGYQPTLVDLEKYRPVPVRKKGHPRFVDADSFARYVNQHKGDGTALYADVESTQVVAVIDGHAPTGPGWGQHRATLKLTHTKAWQRWATASGLNNLMSQELFAEFIEDSVEDVVDPNAATLIELARSFEATKGVNFKSAVRSTDGGRQLTYEETIEGRAGNSGTITIPEILTLALPVFEGATARDTVKAKFRWRLRGGSVTLGFELDRPEDVIRRAWADILTEIEHGTTGEDGKILSAGTGITPFAGVPSA